MELLRKVELLAPQLSRAHLLLAGQRVLKLADRTECAAEQRADQLDDSPLLPIHLSFSTGVESLHWTGAGAAAAQPSVRDDDGSGSVGSLEGEGEAASSSCEPLKLSRIWPVLTRLMVMSLWSVGVLVASRFARQRTGTVP